METEGKKIAFLGDSITEGARLTDLNYRYDNCLKRLLNLSETFNYGIGGTRLAYQVKPSNVTLHDLYMCGRACRLNAKADIIIVYGGVNDYIHGDAPFGEETDTTPATFCGAVNFLMDYLPGKYPNAKIVFLTPARMHYDGVSDLVPSTRACKQPDAKPLYDYVRVIAQAGEKRGIPVLNLYEKLGINPNNEEDRVKYTADGLHFNEAGHQALAACVADFLKKL